MTHLSLFSGIGGIDLAAHWAGFRTVQFVEQNPFCQKVLAKNFPGVPIHDDICTFDGERYRGTTTLISGGFPCQDISSAGKREGLAGDRSGLWFRMLEVIASVRPSWVVAENVANIYNLGVDACLDGLGALGYAARPIGVEASHAGAPFKGLRVFIVARSTTSERYEPKASNGELERERSEFKTLGSPYAWWETRTSEAPVFGMDDGVPRRLDKDRLKALGNAVVPQQVYPILEAIAKVERAEVAG